MPRSNASTIIIILLLIIIGLLVYNNFKKPAAEAPSVTNSQTQRNGEINPSRNDPSVSDIRGLTSEAIVVPYVKKNGRLPDYYITKKEARQRGWNPAEGNLCDVMPGRAIGGDVFTNREGSLPAQSGRKWFEADLNFGCGNRNADRLLYSNDGMVFVTHDHYKTFQEK